VKARDALLAIGRRHRIAAAVAFACLCALALAPAVFAAPPTTSIDPVTEVGISSARVSGEVSVDSEANGGVETYWCFQYTVEAQEAWNNGPCGGPIAPGTSEAIEGDLTGLHAGTSYEARISVVNFNDFVEEFSEPTAPFTTGSVANDPSLELEATPSYTSAQIVGHVDPEGGNENSAGNPVPIHWAIELSETGEPDTWFGVAEGDITGPEAEGDSGIEVSAEPTGLTSKTTYHYRLRATYAGEEVAAADTFETLEVTAPSATVEDATGVTDTSAHFEGEVTLAQADPGFYAECRFEYVRDSRFLEDGYAQAQQIPCDVNPVEAAGSTAPTTCAWSPPTRAAPAPARPRPSTPQPIPTLPPSPRRSRPPAAPAKPPSAATSTPTTHRSPTATSTTG
jgi:hypothetical protein